MPRKNKGVHVWYRKERDCWEVGEYVSGKLKRHATGFSCRSDAEKKLAEVIIQQGMPKKAENLISIGEIIAYYIHEHVPTLASPATALKCFDRLLPYWGDLRLEDIRKSKCRDYLSVRKKEFIQWQREGAYKTERTLSDETVRRELEQLQAAIRYAWSDNVIASFPAVWKPKKCQPKDRWLTKREAALLLASAKKFPEAGEYLYLFILLGLYTGARSTAILSLRWADVDFSSGLINFKSQGETQNKKKSIVPMPKRLFREMKKARVMGTETGYVIHQKKVVSDTAGKKIIQIPIKSIKGSFGSACKKAGLEKVTPHTLRHTAASWMVQKGVPLHKVAKYIGTTMEVIEKTYGHLEPDHLKEAMESYG